MTDHIPTAGEHRGVGLHIWQDLPRLNVVRGDIDAVFALGNAETLYAFAADTTRAPEARLLAAARLRALFEVAAERREVRPDIDLEKLSAHVAALNSMRWISHTHFGTALAPGHAPGELPRPMRPRPLTDDEIELARER